MAKVEKDRASADLIPLRNAAQEPGTSPEERWLAAGMTALYGREPAVERIDPAVGWAALQAQAQQLARQRRRWYLLRELAGDLVPRPMQILAVCCLGLLLCSRGDRLVLPQAPESPLVSAPRAALQEVSRSLRLLGGAEVQVERASIEIEQADSARTRIALRKGAVRLHVPPLPERGRLVVATSDAEVIVHGTRFTVHKVDAESTRITVEEGLVEVRPQGGDRTNSFLRPGESLLVPSLARYRSELAARVGQAIESGRCDDPERSVDRYLELAPADADLSAVHYLKGFCAAQRREIDEAIRWFERAAQSRDRVRADNALARAAKLRAERNEQEGAAAWRRYLERFPDGIHHQSAQRFLGGQP